MAQMFVNGESVDSISGEVTEIYNPANGDLVDTVPKGTKDDARQAIDVAYDVFQAWWDTPFSKRGEILFNASHLIRENEKELATLLTKEQGKPLREAFLEIQRFAHTLDHYAGLAKNIRGGYVPRGEERRKGLRMKRKGGWGGERSKGKGKGERRGKKREKGRREGRGGVVKPARTTPLTATKGRG
ncbi:aldehyde dehydrogenase family protein, partial [candidate division KSB1 bacterium]|nr:aldehyde dehydrogenase family protein [candidate division KSB1 bacterium]